MVAVIACRVLSTTFFLQENGLATDDPKLAKNFRDRHECNVPSMIARMEWSIWNCGPYQYNWQPAWLMHDGSVVIED